MTVAEDHGTPRRLWYTVSGVVAVLIAIAAAGSFVWLLPALVCGFTENQELPGYCTYIGWFPVLALASVAAAVAGAAAGWRERYLGWIVLGLAASLLIDFVVATVVL
jgi:hypothetical protein